MDLLTLPEDILRELLGYLDIKSMVMFTSTTKHLRAHGLETYRHHPVHFHSWQDYISTRTEIHKEEKGRCVTIKARHAAIDAIWRASLQWEQLRLPSDKKLLQQFRRDLIDLPNR